MLCLRLNIRKIIAVELGSTQEIHPECKSPYTVLGSAASDYIQYALAKAFLRYSRVWPCVLNKGIEVTQFKLWHDNVGPIGMRYDCFLPLKLKSV